MSFPDKNLGVFFRTLGALSCSLNSGPLARPYDDIMTSIGPYSPFPVEYCGSSLFGIKFGFVDIFWNYVWVLFSPRSGSVVDAPIRAFGFFLPIISSQVWRGELCGRVTPTSCSPWFLHRGPHALGWSPSWAKWGGRSASCGISGSWQEMMPAKHFVREAVCLGVIPGDVGSERGPFSGRLSPSFSPSSSRSGEPHLFLRGKLVVTASVSLPK